MRLTDVQLFPVELTCTHPSDRTPDLRQHVLIKLVATDGLVGWGEITGQAVRPLNGPTVADLQAGLRQVLVGRDPVQVTLVHRALTPFLGQAARPNQIRCGVDLALHDLIGRALGVPVHVLLGGAAQPAFAVGHPIPAHRHLEEVPATIEYLGQMLARGFSQVRFYIGLNLEADALCLRLMRETYGDRITIKTLDCNGHLDWKAARAAIRRFAEYGFLLVESPARRGDYAGLAEVRRSIDVPVSEHAYTLADAAQLVATNSADIFNITTVGAGGITAARKIAALAEAAGKSCLLGAAHETSIGTAGQAHLGAALPRLDYPCDCIGPAIYARDVVTDPIRYVDGWLEVPTGPGLGLTVDEASLADLAPAAGETSR